jgi:hypothetical protein
VGGWNPSCKRLFGLDHLDHLTEPRLVRWVARTRDLEATVRAARSAGFDLGPAAAGSRTRPDGSLVSWRFTDPYADPAGAVVPFLLDWGATPNPA